MCRHGSLLLPPLLRLSRWMQPPWEEDGLLRVSNDPGRQTSTAPLLQWLRCRAPLAGAAVNPAGRAALLLLLRAPLGPRQLSLGGSAQIGGGWGVGRLGNPPLGGHAAGQCRLAATPTPTPTPAVAAALLLLLLSP